LRRAKSLSDGNDRLDGNMLGKILRDCLIRAGTPTPSSKPNNPPTSARIAAAKGRRKLRTGVD